MAGKIKGAEQNSAPNHYKDSNKIVDICLLLSIVSLFALLISELYHNDAMAAFCMGAMIASGFPVLHHNLKRRKTWKR